MKKIVFSTGAEASITDTSSIYLLGIPTKDATEVAAFKEKLTDKNLSSFSIVDEGGIVVDSAENFTFVEITSDGIDPNRNETNFQLRAMSSLEIRISELEGEKEVQAEAIAELAEMIAGE